MQAMSSSDISFPACTACRTRRIIATRGVSGLYSFQTALIASYMTTRTTAVPRESVFTYTILKRITHTVTGWYMSAVPKTSSSSWARGPVRTFAKTREKAIANFLSNILINTTEKSTLVQRYSFS